VINIEIKPLAVLRKQKDLTQQGLADMIKVSRKKIYRWEHGCSSPVAIEKEKLCLIFHMTESELIQALELNKEVKLKKPHVIAFRVTDNLYEKIETNAKKTNMKMSSYVSETYDGGTVVVIEGLKDFMKELSKSGTNLNQLTTLCNMGKIIAPDLKSIKDTINDIYIKLNRFITSHDG